MTLTSTDVINCLRDLIGKQITVIRSGVMTGKEQGKLLDIKELNSTTAVLCIRPFRKRKDEFVRITDSLLIFEGTESPVPIDSDVQLKNSNFIISSGNCATNLAADPEAIKIALSINRNPIFSALWKIISCVPNKAEDDFDYIPVYPEAPMPVCVPVEGIRRKYFENLNNQKNVTT